jgi:hypothetical protein
MPMNTPAPKRIRRSKELLGVSLGVSAVTFLTLCVWIGPHAACWLVAIAAIIAMWVWLCRCFPTFVWLTAEFFDGFLGGLFGYRSGVYYRPRYRRRRW